ncbi:biotin transport system substrate-specific component [Saccharopolyspora antimicrobica]|uniref:Biotin transporter n=1 Tax=Saccharopolyspora antimicrobica TaxID=455193 RepID=A0A1I5HZC8_9PSEU|nr:biotin transporter BioY [Saccharopolyspora antimicrobica]RKT83128.1 biotin transport system substrate-specific component [Saccharopolyspora antimicrobica]SFO53694.1 biotin transport system substrate-specific component [Saccharopolyspora antimicrobica]
MSAPRQTAPAANLARTVVFAAFIAVLGIFPGFYLGGAAVPIVLQNMGPLLAGSILGARRGGASVLLFLALVAIGLPLLSGGRGGIAPFVGPSGGFVLGWVLSAVVVGLIVQLAPKPTLLVLLVANLAGVAVDYLIGIPYWGLMIGDLGAAAAQSLVFVPGDLVKLVAVSLVAVAVHRAVPSALTGTARRAPIES